VNRARVGVVTTSYPRWPGDAAGHFVGSHARWLADRGHEVTVVAAGDGDSAGAKIQVVRVPDRGGLFYGSGAPEQLEERAIGGAVAGVRFTASLAAAVRKHAKHWDAVACHWLVPSAAVAAPLTRGPLLAIAHSGDVHVLARRGLLAPTLAALLARGARLVFVAPELLELARDSVPRLLRGALDGASIVHPMGLELERFAAIAAHRAHRRPHLRPKIGVIGRLVPVKGLELLLDALEDLREPVDLLIAGDGPLRPALEQRASATARRHHVRFLGHLPAERRDAMLAELDLLVAPSVVLPGGRTEGTPTAVLEAVAAAVPVLTSDAGGLASLPAPWTTRVPAGDRAALAHAITTLLADSARQARATEAARSIGVLDWRVVGRRLHDHWFGVTG
jgi:glycosyltransferase involved in cell wall biosynthesis